MNKRNTISILIILTLLFTTLFTGCHSTSDEENSNDKTRTELLREFSELSETPRVSEGDLSAITKYITNKVKEMNLEVTKDEAGNLMVEKPATPGYQNAPTTIIHTNIDMVPKADSSIIFDPKKDSITPIIDEEEKEITGNHTNLGASSGLGIASSFLILNSTSSHGPIKVIYTVNGEISMSGAKNIDPKFLEGDYLINLNNNKSEVIEIGSAYSSICKVDQTINKQSSKNKYAYVLVADGFVGGDSGEGAQNIQGNPIKFLAEVMALAKGEGLMFELADMEAGNNAYNIPKTATATITVNKYEKGKINSIFAKAKEQYLKDHAKSDPDATLDIIETTVPDKVFSNDDASNLISFLYSLQDGIYNDKSHTTASSNIGSISISETHITMDIFVQGKLEASVNKIIEEHKAIAQISKLSINAGDAINGYYTKKSLELPTKLNTVYKDTLDIPVETLYRPCRTELGFFQEKNPDLQMASIGPTIKKEGSTAESVYLDTVDVPASAVLNFLTSLK